ncbi:MAG TPA: YihY/virulence factor BrkB family protein [Bacteroidota bacterium]|nr:YihY/virulence factor BrkB family protein [Bacteroidota bacterium]
MIRRIGRTIRYYGIGIHRRMSEENVLFLASGIAFNCLLCLLPLLLLLTSLVGMFLSSPRFPAQKVDEVLNAIFPLQPYAQQIKASIKDMLEDIVRYKRTFEISGIGVLIWTAASLFSSVRTVVNKIYRCRPTKMMVLNILENILLVVGLGILFLVANAFTWVLLLTDSLIKQIPGLDFINLNVSTKTFQSITSFLAVFIMFYGINRFVPEGKIEPRIALAASVTSASLWWIAGKAFGWYLTAFHSYSKVYGTYAFLLVFLVWMYYSSVVFVVGVVVGQLRRERPVPP